MGCLVVRLLHRLEVVNLLIPCRFVLSERCLSRAAVLFSLLPKSSKESLAETWFIQAFLWEFGSLWANFLGLLIQCWFLEFSSCPFCLLSVVLFIFSRGRSSSLFIFTSNISHKPSSLFLTGRSFLFRLYRNSQDSKIPRRVRSTWWLFMVLSNQSASEWLNLLHRSYSFYKRVWVSIDERSILESCLAIGSCIYWLLLHKIHCQAWCFRRDSCTQIFRCKPPTSRIISESMRFWIPRTFLFYI